MTHTVNLFNNVLIANRGEIACRIIETVQRIGLKAIAVYSQADADAPHVKMADQAMFIGPPAVVDSYLNIEKILSAARAASAQDHPSYGFSVGKYVLHESLRRCPGLVFIGPPARTPSTSWATKPKPSGKCLPPACRAFPAIRERRRMMRHCARKQ
ncbi:MAG: biotin carboxylase N-terminal domain-containing protein [Parvularculaceae bacterium]